MRHFLIETIRKEAIMSKKLIWLATFALALIIGQPSFACDKGQNCNAHHRLDKLAAELNLTPEQQAKIKAYKAQARASMKDNYAQLKALRGQINTLVKADKIDEAKLNSLVSQVNKIRGDMLKNRIMMQHEMYALLTAKQKIKFDELKKKWEEKHH